MSESKGLIQVMAKFRTDQIQMTKGAKRMSKKTKTVTGLVIAICLVFAIASACTSNTSTPSESTSTPGTSESGGTTTQPAAEPDTLSFPLQNPITIDFVIAEHPTQGKYSWAADNHPGFQWLEEQTNITINTTHIPQGNVQERMNLMLSTNDLPDLLFPQGANWQLNDIEQAGQRGLFVNILDEKYKHLIPNYLKLIEETPSLQALVNDGKLYGFYQVDPNAALFTRTMPYRKDIFDKHNINVETWDELYEALKVLKQQYPNSYPFGGYTQGGGNRLLQDGPPGFQSGQSIYYNHNENAWVYGATEDNYKLFLEFFAKLYQEGLLHPEFSTMSQDQWSQSWINDEIFISYWVSATGNWFSPDSPSNNPDFGRDKEWVEAHRIPSLVKGGPRGWTSVRAPSNVYDPKLISTSSDHIEEILMLMDFTSVTENVANMSYGPQGVEWDIIDGKYQWLAKDIKVAYNPDGTKSVGEYFSEKYGIGLIGENNFSNNNDSQIAYDINDAYADADYEQFLNEIDMYVEDGSTLLKPQPILRLSETDTERQTQLKAALDTYADEMTIKIISGQLPVSEWDNLKKTLESMGVNDLIELYKKGSGM